MATAQPAPKSAQVTQSLSDGALNLPNLITVSRLFLSIALFGLIAHGQWWMTATILFVVAAGTDFLDGYFARKWQQVTVLGRILDPFVDKIIVCGAFVFLTENADSGVNAWMAIAVIGREMFVSTLRGFLEKQGLDFSANLTGKAKMVLQCVAVTAALYSLTDHGRSEQIILIRDVVLWGAVLVTIISGIVYFIRGSRLLRNAALPSDPRG